MTATEPLSSPESPTATPSFTPVPSLTAIVCSTGTPAGFIPSDDAYIDSASPTTVFGAGNALDVRPDNDADRRGLLRFDLSSIPPNATVTEATLYLYESSSLTGQTTYIYRLTSDWEEQSVTWQSWQTPGGDFDRSFSYLSYSPQQSNCMLALDITSLASAWVNGTFPNQGLMLYSTGPDQGISYSSKEHETAGQWPRLDVHYRVVPSEP